MVPNRATHQSSTHDPRLLSYSTLFKDAQSGDGIPKKSKSLGDFGETPLVTIGDTAYPCLEWLFKWFNEHTRDFKVCYYNNGCHRKHLWYAKRKITNNL